MNVEPQFDVPDGWTAIPRAIVEERFFPDAGKVMHVIGWELVRDKCGCTMVLGMRMDRDEPTSGLFSCDNHDAECRLVLHALQTMEPRDDPVVTLACSMLDDAVE